MNQTIKELTKNQIETTFTLALGLAVASIPLAIAAGVVGAVLWGVDVAYLIAGLAVLGAVSFGALHIARAMLDTRGAVVKAIAAIVDYQNAQADKLYSEADAIRAAAERSAGAQVVNVNAGAGTMNVRAKPITYRVNGQVVNGNQLNQTNQIDARTIEIPAADVRWFVEQLAAGYGHSKSKWLAVRDADGKTHPVELPYSRQPITYAIYAALVGAIADAGGIVGRGERASGTLIERSPAQLVKMIEATHPDAGSKGITLELSTTASA